MSDRLTLAKVDALVTLLCDEPISTGITDGRPTFEPCGRARHGGLPLCKDHALERGLLRRPPPPSVARRIAERKPRRGRR